MAGLPWVRLDTAFASNPKILALLSERDGHRAAFVYICGITYSGKHGTNGRVVAEALPFVHGRPKDAALLVKHRLWHQDVGGWLINDWDERQVSDEAARMRREKARDAARKRWGTDE